MTALDKQARELEKLAKEYLWGAYANAKDEFEEVAELVKLLTQVREQTVAECAGKIESALNGFFDEEWEGTVCERDRKELAKKLRSAFILPAPPETTEQEER